MQTSVIKIGNSKGIRLPKAILENYDIGDTLEIILEKEYIVLKPIASARKGWDVAFQTMHQEGDDALLMPDVFEDEALDEWTE
jgi:antitoxin MazE